MKKIVLLLFFIVSLMNAGWNPMKTENSSLEDKTNMSLKNIRAENKNLDIFFDNAYAYVIYPSVGKAGFGIGGAYGEGVIYKDHKPYAYSDLSQLTIGFQMGGQVYTEIIFFKDKEALDRFEKGNFELGVQASAVILDAGATFNLEYSNGIAIFTLTKGGLMYEASVGGQKFSFKKKD